MESELVVQLGVTSISYKFATVYHNIVYQNIWWALLRRRTPSGLSIIGLNITNVKLYGSIRGKAIGDYSMNDYFIFGSVEQLVPGSTQSSTWRRCREDKLMLSPYSSHFRLVSPVAHLSPPVIDLLDCTCSRSKCNWPNEIVIYRQTRDWKSGTWHKSGRQIALWGGGLRGWRAVIYTTTNANDVVPWPRRLETGN